MKMVAELKMPKYGSMMTEGRVEKWYKNEGDPVTKGEAVLAISTEKLNNDVDSTVTGVIIKIVAQPGDQVPVAGVLALIETN